jgi:outer membrane protein TolC
VGLDFDIPFQRSKEKAALKVSRVDLEKRKLSTANIRTRLKTDFGILQERLEAQKAAIDLAEKRLALAQDILKAESKEYTYGRTDINDLIIALNTFQEARFTKISYEIGLDVLLVEWQRLTDRIVTKNDIKRARSVTGGHK